MKNQRYTNALLQEKSPYLLQHAHNPVNWYPWGAEAFEKAKKENKPVFVSIGYSTCHWCHVMEKESFENEEVAKLLNDRFVSIKVDREERPDIDSIYMQVCQMMTGHGGWPMSVYMTPEKVPFYTGTYFPKEARYGQPGFKDLIVGLSNKYLQDPEHINEVVESVLEALRPEQQAGKPVKLTREVIENCFDDFVERFDGKYGGFGEAPKFPMPHTLMFLLRYYKYQNDEHALDMVAKTLDGLARGGIYDHVGFGFSRYSVDEYYLVPHFEKMLYDNALLAMAYTEAYQNTKSDHFKQVAEQIFTYILRDMQHGEGGFYSAEDADSEGEEGKFYVWTPDEVMKILGEELGGLYCQIYDITEHGNFEGKNIPNLINVDLITYASQNNLPVETLKKQLQEARQRLFEHREKRVHPHKDDKILTSWNALMIASLAKSGRVFAKEEYLWAAERAISFIENKLIIDDRLMVRYRDGEVKNKGFIDDYAFMVWAYIEMYESTLQLKYLRKAIKLTNDMIELFWDKQAGGFFFSGSDNEELLVRQKEVYDGAIPSGNSVAAMQMIRLSRLTGDYELEEKVQKLYDVFSEDLTSYPTGHTLLLQSYLITQMAMKEVIVLSRDKNYDDLLRELQQEFHPEITYLISSDQTELAEAAPFTKDYQILDSKTTIYVCENFVCNKPTNDLDGALQLINKKDR
ncbi:thioredoxin domain-containing protein [Neobacillus cucumis]|uniref:thioredoxin domain-containing protein n=1 Tax=Neobacillus cucumis TaxID=1740721 RepID=UPI00203C8647|nr:thioredoxin domain-containing protein [Neobacillus cucumis]MCM3727522.1 thioredoxin domain-containing protein [Neobacillus cucumis]